MASSRKLYHTLVHRVFFYIFPKVVHLTCLDLKVLFFCFILISRKSLFKWGMASDFCLTSYPCFYILFYMYTSARSLTKPIYLFNAILPPFTEYPQLVKSISPFGTKGCERRKWVFFFIRVKSILFLVACHRQVDGDVVALFSIEEGC